ncbi:MAG: hypothetical protein QM734_03720 [Cyclobacteriaceae bacterium]
MSTRRIIFLLIFGLYQLTIVFFTIYMESMKDDLNFLFEIFKYIGMFKYGALLGVVLVVIEFFWSRAELKKSSNS